MRFSRLLLVIVPAIALTGAGVKASTPAAADLARSPLAQKRPAPSRAAPVLVAVGDIAWCGGRDDEATARLVDRIRGTIATLGDNVYPDGTAEEFASCYEPSWGRHKHRTRPSPGNHDYHTPAARGYFGYFGRRAGPTSRGYYSYDLGSWHVISLNSELEGGARSVQERWLRADLARNRARCTLAYWHRPRFSSGSHGSDGSVRPFWDALYQARADVVLSGHDHNYQRFARQRPDGTLDRRRGLRQFIVGTGGRSLYGFGRPIAHTERYNTETYGVLKLTLRRAGYAWRFVSVPGKRFTDAGSAPCH